MSCKRFFGLSALSVEKHFMVVFVLFRTKGNARTPLQPAEEEDNAQPKIELKNRTHFSDQRKTKKEGGIKKVSGNNNKCRESQLDETYNLTYTC